MFRILKVIVLILKSHGKYVFKGVYNFRYFYRVEFHNTKNIYIHPSVNIEQDSRVWAIKPISENININIKSDCWIGRDVEIQSNYGSKICIEENVSIQDRCKILGEVFIGKDTLLAPDVFLSSGNHFFNYLPHLPIKEQDRLLISTSDGFAKHDKPIFINEDCWIGKNVLIKNGIHIGRGSIIAANSFVNSDVPPYQVYAGTPARFIKNRINFDPPNEISFKNKSHLPYFYFGFDHVSIENGILSNNKSICVLKREEDFSNNSLHIKGFIVYPGILKLWYNDVLIMNKSFQIGEIEEIMCTQDVVNLNHISPEIYEGLLSQVRNHNLIIFEFTPYSKLGEKNFMINKLSLK